MGRRRRLFVPGGLYHVMLRGNNRGDIFRDDSDRWRFYDYLAEAIDRFGVRLHVFCCMTNHVHLLPQVGRVGLDKFVHRFAFRYAQWFNRRWGRTGHFFDGRYRDILVDGDSYLLELVRYIHLNPVRANIVERPEDYRWSSARHYLGKESLPFVTSDWVLSLFGKNVGAARRRLHDYVYEGIGEEVPRSLQESFRELRALGSDEFVKNALASVEEETLSPLSLDSIVEAVCAEYGVSFLELESPTRTKQLCEARGALAFLVREVRATTLAELARLLHRNPATMTIAANRADARASRNHDFADRLARLCRKVTKMSNSLSLAPDREA